MVSFMTLQNSMYKRKLKNHQVFDHTLFYDCVCVCAGPALCVCVCVCVCVKWFEGGWTVFSV